MSSQLVPITSGMAPPVILSRPVVLIGRHLECDIRIESMQISRRHCCIALAYDRVVIRDLGSRHGVRVNGQLVDEARLNYGDEVAIGPFIYRLENLSPPASPKTTKPLPAPADDSDSIIELDDEMIPLD